MVGELFAVQVLGRSRGHEQIDALNPPGLAGLELDLVRGVEAGLGVGHHDRGADSPGQSRRGARLGGLLVLKARLTEVHLDVDQARQGPQALAIHVAGVVRNRGGFQGDALRRHQKIGDAIDAGLRIDHAGTLDE